MGTISYLRNFARDRNIASITPTSSFGVNRIMRGIDFKKAKVIVEYGPGLGVFTEKLLAQMHEDAMLIAIEANSHFARALSAKFEDSRAHIVNDSAENVLDILQGCNVQSADYIISGIPFSMFPVELKDRILDNTRQALSKEGRFFVYQFFGLPSKSKTDIKYKLAEHMDIVRSEVEMLNIPPLRIFEAAAAAESARSATS